MEAIGHPDFDGWGLFDKRFFRVCFENGLNKVLITLLTKFHVKGVDGQLALQWASNFLMRDQNKTTLFTVDFKANEDVVTKVLELFTTQISSSLSCVVTETKENLLHIFLKKRMKNAVMVLMENYDVTDLLFTPNIAGDIPLSLAISQGLIKDDNTPVNDIATAIWELMLHSNRNSDIGVSITELNSKSKNILHTCSESRMNNLFAKICLAPELDKSVIEKAVNEPNAVGLTPLECCDDEQTVLKIMDAISSFDTEHVDVDRNNVIHIYAKKNFQTCVRKIILQEEKRVRELLLHKNKNGNHPLMSCVLRSSEDVLNFLLGFLLTMDKNEKNKTLIKHLLHQPNTKGDTLLGVILHYQQGTLVPQTIAIELEKYCHTIPDDKPQTLKNLAECLRHNVDPSIEVQKVMKDVHESYDKSRIEKIWISIKLFWSSCLVPMSVMISDLTFDAILVTVYACYLWIQDDRITSIDQMYACNVPGNSIDDFTTPVYQPLSQQTYSPTTMTTLTTLSTSDFLQDIPNGLNGRSRYFYSAVFMILPSFFYGFEFRHSRHYSTTAKKVYIFDNTEMMIWK